MLLPVAVAVVDGWYGFEDGRSPVGVTPPLPEPPPELPPPV